uniref:chitinase n=1 Tax=Branchiostoma floridae TaxID=7739 RepID=C3ZU42_BRAFL|eukprot:XP_002587917.1 hypothetical protein BRAFLDRAFT_87305 [Branchiostoma floridae]
MKLFCLHLIPKEQRAQLKRIVDVFHKLMELDKIDQENLEFIEEILERIGRQDLIRDVLRRFQPPDREIPENPELQPENPEFQPENPELQAENPEFQPENPELQPENPEFQPENPELQPENPELQPENPENQPETPELQPGASLLGTTAEGDVQGYFDDVIEEVSYKWDDLAWKLGFQDNEIKVIRDLERDHDRRCREMLNRWRNREGRGATLQVLIQALKNIGETRTAESLEETPMSNIYTVVHGHSSMTQETVDRHRQNIASACNTRRSQVKFRGYKKHKSILVHFSIPRENTASTDFARYWCTVAEWGVRTELGVDAKSVLLTETGHSQHVIDISVSGERGVGEGADVEMTCQCHGCHYPTFDWFKGSAFAGSEWVTTGIRNYTHIAAKEYLGIMGFVDLEIEDGFDQFSVTPSNSLRLTGAQVNDAGRYWCKVKSGGSVDIKATVLKVKDPEDCAMYYQCLYGFPQPFHRPFGYAGMVFNPEHLYCDWAFNVGPPCGSKA